MPPSVRTVPGYDGKPLQPIAACRKCHESTSQSLHEETLNWAELPASVGKPKLKTPVEFAGFNRSRGSGCRGPLGTEIRFLSRFPSEQRLRKPDG